jgi:heptosyltransferase-3
VSGTTEQSILAIHAGALGDVILMGHLLGVIGGRATIVARGELAGLLAGTAANAALDFDALPMHEVFLDDPPADGALAGLLGRHDALVSCFAAGDERAEARLAEMCGASQAAFLPTRPPEGFAGHLMDLWAAKLPASWSAAASEQLTCPRAWSIPGAWSAAAAAALGELGIEAAGRYAVIHPGAGAEAKCWPLERFLEVASTLRGGLAVVFALGPVELDRWRERRVQRVRGEFPVLAGERLSVLAGVLAGAAGYLGNDSGVSHLAAAVGTPTVALFGPTDPRHFRPIGPRVQVLAAETMAGIRVEDVLTAAREWL